MSARLVVRAKTAMISLDREVCQDANTTHKCKLRWNIKYYFTWPQWCQTESPCNNTLVKSETKMKFMKWYIWKLTRPGQTLLCRALSHSDLSQVSAERQYCCQACHSCLSELCKDQTDLSLVSKTLCQVIVLGSMSKKANFLKGDFHKNKNTKKRQSTWLDGWLRAKDIDLISSAVSASGSLLSIPSLTSLLTWHDIVNQEVCFNH